MVCNKGSDDDTSADAPVGYGNPPQDTRFAPGQSGNPGGRPKGPRTLALDLREELEAAVTLTEGEGGGEGEPPLSKQRTILRRLTAKAVEGDARATALVLGLARQLFGAGAAPEEEEEDEDEGEDPRLVLAARIAAISQRMAAYKRDPLPGEDQAGAEEGAGPDEADFDRPG